MPLEWYSVAEATCWLVIGIEAIALVAGIAYALIAIIGRSIS
jgi:hypothetical protein